MNFKAMAKTAMAFMTLLGEKKLPIDAENQKLNLDATQRQKIVDALGEDLAQEAINGIDQEIKDLAQNNLDLKAIQDEIAALVKETNLTEEELKDVASNKDADDSSATLASIKAIGAKTKEMEKTIAKL